MATETPHLSDWGEKDHLIRKDFAIRNSTGLEYVMFIGDQRHRPTTHDLLLWDEAWIGMLKMIDDTLRIELRTETPLPHAYPVAYT